MLLCFSSWLCRTVSSTTLLWWCLSTVNRGPICCARLSPRWWVSTQWQSTLTRANWNATASSGWVRWQPEHAQSSSAPVLLLNNTTAKLTSTALVSTLNLPGLKYYVKVERTKSDSFTQPTILKKKGQTSPFFKSALEIVTPKNKTQGIDKSQHDPDLIMEPHKSRSNLNWLAYLLCLS